MEGTYVLHEHVFDVKHKALDSSKSA